MPIPPQPTTVFAFVTEPLLAEGLTKVLGSCPDLEYLGFSADPKTVMEDVERLHPGLLLLDQAFGLRVVFDLLSALRRSTVWTHPVLWAKEISTSDRRSALEAGLRGLLDRKLPVATMIDCLRTVASGDLWIGEPEAAAALEPRGAHRLTQRERAVVTLVRDGLKNREIAERLEITAGTVKVHLMHIFEKTGARDRFELRMQAARLLLDAEAASQALSTAARGGGA